MTHTSSVVENRGRGNAEKKSSFTAIIKLELNSVHGKMCDEDAIVGFGSTHQTEEICEGT